MRIFKGPLPPSVLNRVGGTTTSPETQPTSLAGETQEKQPPEAMQPVEKVKRKCGRPRNPIPRHKRDSHINAEHRRRGKIQDCFHTLKTMVPRYTAESGRNSKSNVLNNAVDHCRFLQREIQILNSGIENMKAELASLRQDIEVCNTTDVDNLALDTPDTSRLDDHFRYFVTAQAEVHTGWAANGIFLRIAGRLFESFKQSVGDQSTGSTFALSVAKWAINTFSAENLRKVCAVAGESDVDVDYQSPILSRPALSTNDFAKSEELFSSDTTDSYTDTRSNQHHISGHGAHELSNTGHSYQNFSFSEGGKILSSNSDSNDYYLSSGAPIDQNLSWRLSRDDPDSSPTYCPLGQCALQDLTSREFSSFTRRDAQNRCTGDVDGAFGCSFHLESRHPRCFDRAGHEENSMDAHLAPSSLPDVDLHESYSQSESEYPGIGNRRRYPVATPLSYSVSSDDKNSGQISRTAYVYDRDLYSTSPVSNGPQGKTVDGDFVYQSRPWVPNTPSLLKTRPQSADAVYNDSLIQKPHINSFTSPPRSYTIEGGSFSPQMKGSYSHTPDSKPGFLQTKLSQIVVNSEAMKSPEELPLQFRSAEEVKQIHNMRRLNQDPMSSGSYLAQLLQAPLPTLDTVQIVKRSSLTDPAMSSESQAHMETDRPGASFLLLSRNVSRHGQRVQSLNTPTHLSTNLDRPQEFNLTWTHYDTEMERKPSPLPTSQPTTVLVNDQLIPASEETEIDHNTQNSCSDADCLSATCDLYRDAQGAIDMTFESLTHASCGRGKTCSCSGSTCIHCKTRSAYSPASSPVDSSSCEISVREPVSATVTKTHLSFSVPTSRYEDPAALQIKGPHLSQSHRSDDQMTTSDNSQLLTSDFEASHKSVSHGQLDDRVNELNRSLPYFATVSKPTSAPVLKQRYLSQVANTTAQVPQSPEITLPTRQRDTSNLYSNFKRPFCQPDYTQHKWKMRRLVLSGH